MGEPVRRRFSVMETAEQIDTVRGWLSDGLRPYEIRARCGETWGLKTRAAESRIAAARQAMVRDIDAIDRKELAAQALETLLKVQEMSLQTKQCSNAIGSTRLMLELAGILGRTN